MKINSTYKYIWTKLKFADTFCMHLLNYRLNLQNNTSISKNGSWKVCKLVNKLWDRNRQFIIHIIMWFYLIMTSSTNIYYYILMIYYLKNTEVQIIRWINECILNWFCGSKVNPSSNTRNNIRIKRIS